VDIPGLRSRCRRSVALQTAARRPRVGGTCCYRVVLLPLCGSVQVARAHSLLRSPQAVPALALVRLSRLLRLAELVLGPPPGTVSGPEPGRDLVATGHFPSGVLESVGVVSVCYRQQDLRVPPPVLRRRPWWRRRGCGVISGVTAMALWKLVRRRLEVL
jgi:hypothetical protein